MKISIVVPTFNRAQLLPEALDSALVQSLPPHEIIVVDDGSTDDTAEVVRRYSDANDGLIRGISQQNSGKSMALNNALRYVSGTHVLILDDDDILLPNALETHRDALYSSLNEFAFTYGPNVFFEHRSEINLKVQAWNERPWGVSDDQLFIWTLNSFKFQQGAMLVPRALYDQVGGFDETALRGQDYEMALRLCRHFHGIAVQQPVLAYREHFGLRGPSVARHSVDERVAIWRNHDCKVLSALRETVPLSEYLGKSIASNGSPLSASQERKALVQRGVILSRRGLFTEGIQDMEAAARVTAARDLPLRDDELQMLASGLELARYATLPPGTYSFFIRAVRPYCRLGGRSAAVVLLRRVYWSFSERVADGNFPDAAALLAVILAVSCRMLYSLPLAIR